MAHFSRDSYPLYKTDEIQQLIDHICHVDKVTFKVIFAFTSIV
jgi:hypothetical protein